MKFKPLPPLDYLRECFDLDMDTGVLTWKRRPPEHFNTVSHCKTRNTRFSGAAAGRLNNQGYYGVSINRSRYQNHRIVFFMATGTNPEDHEVDHIDGNPGNNAPSNLRLATHALNMLNRKANKNATSGYRGVTFDRRSGKWKAQVGHDGKNYTIGAFKTAEAANLAAVSARQRLHGEFAGRA